MTFITLTDEAGNYPNIYTELKREKSKTKTTVYQLIIKSLLKE